MSSGKLRNRAAATLLALLAMWAQVLPVLAGYLESDEQRLAVIVAVALTALVPGRALQKKPIT
ncbi:hypothetical protein ACSNOI_03225 [Actinomadura kijaniata]|uniref:hypothetical protein n=1 Tax=Actinomadura kijaniata TaxID=46161 RepID=UPI003F1B2664